MTKATGCEVLHQVVYYEVTSLCSRQANQVGYDNGGWTISYILQLKSYGFDKGFGREKDENCADLCFHPIVFSF